MEVTMQKEFYVLSQEYSSYAQAIRENNQMNVTICEKCGAVFETRKVEKFRVHFSGEKEADYYFAPICSIVSDKMIDVLKKENVTGFELQEIACTGWTDSRGKAIDINSERYKELKITGRAGYLRNLNGTYISKCDKCGAKGDINSENVSGLMVDDEWDGADMFYFKNWDGVIIVTKKVKDVLEGNKMKNVSFEPLETFQFL